MVFAASGGSSPATAAPGSALGVILTRRFARQVLVGRWFTVFASLLIMAASGATYVFGSYSGALKSSLGYDQRTLNTVSFFKSSSCCLGSLGGCVRTMLRPPARGEDYTILQALVSVDMLVLFVATTCGMGGTLTAIDNMGQIGESLGYPAKSVNTFVSLISIWNYAGRVAAGYVSEAALARHRVPRPLLLTGVLLLACAGHALIALGAPRSLYAASVVVGFCFGAQWPLVFAIISELFGLRRFSTLHNLGGLASPVGSYILNVRVAGRLYDAGAARQRGGSGRVCIGVECYRRSFLIITAATAAGALVSLVLVWRTWTFYRGDIYARFRDGDGRLPVDQQQEEEEEREKATAANGR